MSAAAALHDAVDGDGPPVALVHGWGLQGAVWDPVVPALTAGHAVHRPDLPGHGRTPLDGPFELQRLADALAATVAGPAWWVGWSLGGLAVLDLAARHPDRVRGLVLVAASPRFVAGPDWPRAMDADTLAGFAADLEADPTGTVQRFLGLVARGPGGMSEVLRGLRRLLRTGPAPDPRALRGGLAILAGTDLRAALCDLACPLRVILGARDTLIPAAVGDDIRALRPDAELITLPGAGHAPFLSHPAAFTAAVREFLECHHG